jgi:hypothetical protein
MQMEIITSNFVISETMDLSLVCSRFECLLNSKLHQSNILCYLRTSFGLSRFFGRFPVGLLSLSVPQHISIGVMLIFKPAEDLGVVVTGARDALDRHQMLRCLAAE